MPSPSLIWFLIGVVFLIIELAVPGFIVIFFTVGCWIAAIVAGFFDVSWSVQILIFIVSSLVCLFASRKYLIKTFKGKTQENMDDDYANTKIGKTAVVTQKIKPNVEGEIKFMGSFWRATADDEIKEGESVVIESQASDDGLTYKVKAV